MFTHFNQVLSKRSDNILAAAIELFSLESFHSVSTSRIAKRAGVSEGLIFTHFKSKQGLLDAVMDQAKDRMAALIGPILLETDPAKIIHKALELPFALPIEDYPFWKLQYKLKWETDYDSTTRLKPLLDKLTEAFAGLNYDAPRSEAELLYHTIDNIAGTIVRNNSADGMEKLKPVLRSKYKI